MSENIILEILGDIRSEIFDILDDTELEKVLKVIDDIFNELMGEW